MSSIPINPVPYTNTEKPLLNSKEASAYIGVLPGTLESWRYSKFCPVPFIKVGRLVKYRRSDLDNFLNQRTVGKNGNVAIWSGIGFQMANLVQTTNKKGGNKMAKSAKAKHKEPDSTLNITIGKHYSPKELASLLGVTIPMLTYLRLTGRGPKFIKFGLRNVIYSAVEVDRYLKERARLSTSDDGTKYTRLASYDTF